MDGTINAVIDGQVKPMSFGLEEKQATRVLIIPMLACNQNNR